MNCSWGKKALRCPYIQVFFRGYEHMYTCENHEVERQRHNKQINYTQDSSFFSRKKKSSNPRHSCSLGERSTTN